MNINRWERSMNSHEPSATNRRSFLGWLAASAVALTSGRPATLSASELRVGDAPDGVDDKDEWLKPMKGRHKQIFDSPGHFNGKALHQVRNYLDAYRERYAAKPGQVNAAVGVTSGKGAAMLFNDAMWSRYRFGEKYAITDPTSKAPSVRNIFANVRTGDPLDATNSVDALLREGVAMLLCNNTFKGMITSIAKDTNQSEPDVRTELLANRIPGVVVVPAMVVAMNRAQDAGFTYYWAGMAGG
jgi:intracellular sulfur oxidation DsrE/DsrF family protein